MFKLMTSENAGTQVGLLFQYSIFTPNFSQIVQLLEAIIQALFFCYLFMMIAKKGGEFASQLTSGPNIGKFAISAGALIAIAMSKLGGKPSTDNKKGSGAQASQSKGSGSQASKALRK